MTLADAAKLFGVKVKNVDNFPRFSQVRDRAGLRLVR